MRAHLAAGEIPDPHTTPYEICGRALDKHHEVIEKTEHFLNLSSRTDTDVEILTGTNLMRLSISYPTEFGWKTIL